VNPQSASESGASGPAIAGPCQVAPPSCVRQTSIWPKPNCGRTGQPSSASKPWKFVNDTYASCAYLPLPATIASLS
jgi:hypothetical protein